MLKKFKIGTKITLVMIMVVIITATVVSFLSHHFSRQSVEQKYAQSLDILARSKADHIQSYFDHNLSVLNYLRNHEQLKSSISLDETSPAAGADPFSMLMEVEEEETSGDETTDIFALGDEPPSDAGDPFAFADMPADEEDSSFDVNTFLNSIKTSYQLENILIVTPGGSIIHSTDPGRQTGTSFNDEDGHTLKNAIHSIYHSNVFQQGDQNFIYSSGRITANNQDIAVLLLQINMARIYDFIQDTTGLGKTGECVLARLDSSDNRINTLNRLRNDPGASIKVISLGESKSLPVQNAVTGTSGTGIGIDYRGNEVLAAWTYIPNAKWGLVTKIDTAEILSESSALVNKFVISGLVIVLLVSFLAIAFSNYLIRPMKSLYSSLQLIGQGILPEHIDKESNDEIGDMADKVGELVQSLKNTANFAQKIGEGKFDSEFQPISENDTLGTSLLTMRDNLIENERKDNERNWIVRGLAEIGDILRAFDNLETLGDEVIQFIVGKIEAIQGAFYVVNDDNENDVFIEMKASFAYNRKKYLQRQFRFAEGLVGQSAIEQATVLRTEVPDDYVSVTSGILGDQKPSCILIVPLITDEKVYGVLEFAGFNRFSSMQVKYVEELSVILARTIFNIKVNERTRKLLEESQAMSNELQEKQEVLRQNAEEMQATQEELKRSNVALEEQIEEVNNAQKRMQLLLENASEVITIYEEDKTIRYVSPSVEPILGYTINEMMGSTDMDKVHPDHKDTFNKMFTELMEHPEKQVTVQYEYITKDGQYKWLESTGTNLLSNPAIQGLVINVRDITERRRAEQEQRMRSKMQALSENSLDLITRLEDGHISYINPVIEEYTGNKPQHFINQTFDKVDLNQNVLDHWVNILKEVNESNDKVASEMDFPSEMGDRIMQVNAIPEFDEASNLESVLVVSHDITERKLIELEIKNKNKKINDSINYSKRIQNAILPNNKVIGNLLPNSFILYKPKDVVSGDFPWYAQAENMIYIAAVDCTGHGVPGAMLSLIGYFLLNDIVKSRKISDPGLILDQLDEGVTQTLRQDQDGSNTKDGMDIALCKIDRKNKVVEYAGAHRPLYVMKDEEMLEIKGNKFAIGGGIYKNQTNFTTHKLKLSEGDSIFFCSDGYPDQFGGPENRKFGPRRLRELVTRIHKKPMPKACEIFNKEWETWQGKEKQTDDVLLIGIKF